MINRLLAVLLFGSLVCLAFVAEPVSGANWARFRGPNGTGEASDKDIPVEFSGEKGFLWKTPLPGAGHSSPIVFNQKIFLQTANNDASERIMLCLNLADGKVVWQTTLPGGVGVKHPKYGSFASPTAASDGTRVYMPFWDGKNLIVAAFDFNDGKLLWKRDLGPFTSQHGLGHSPMLFGGKMILANDQDGSAALIALDVENGSTAWQVDRPFNRACYSTPSLLDKPDGSQELLVASTAGLYAYDPAKGTENWHWNWTGNKLRTVGSAVYNNGMIYLGSGDGSGARNAVGVKLNRQGAMVEASLAWEEKKSFPYVPTMLTKGPYLYSINDSGVAFCHVGATGEKIWEKRLGGNFFSSPVMIDGKIYAANDAGEVFVFPAEPKFELLAQNSLGETVMATPAVADGRLLLRGSNHLFCFGKAPAK